MKQWCKKRYEQIGGTVATVRVKPALRVNTRVTTAAKLKTRLKKSGIELERIPFTQNGFWVTKSRVSPGATTEYLLGQYYLQEAAAQLPVHVLDPKPGEKVLDCCAAPGGKTTQIAQRMKNRGLLVAYEKKKHRIPSLLVNLERMGVTNCIAYHRDILNAHKDTFDKILVDAPC